MTLADELRAYLQEHFVQHGEFVAASGTTASFVEGLVDAAAIPGPIYRIWPDGRVWSALEAPAESIGESTAWHNPAAIWWVRRAAVLSNSGMTDFAAIAEAFRRQFAEDFARALDACDWRFGYPDLDRNGEIDVAARDEMAVVEWDSWIDGGYGVCLRRADASHVVTKTVEAGRVRALTDLGTKQQFSPQEHLELLHSMELLDGVMLPFAPHQRPTGTPGRWVDAVLARNGFGHVPLVKRVSATAVDDHVRLCA